MTQDTDDLLMAALDPGEKIVWSDRPHRISSSALHMIWRRLTTWTGLLSFAFLALVVWVFVNVKEGEETGRLSAFGWEALGVPLVLGVAAVPIIFETFRFLHGVARTASHRYAVTDKGRGIFVLPELTGTFTLPRPDRIATRATGAAEHGDIELGICEVVERPSEHRGAPSGRPVGPARRGPRQIVFRSVSYPLVAVETIRAVAQGNRNC